MEFVAAEERSVDEDDNRRKAMGERRKKTVRKVRVAHELPKRRDRKSVV